MRTLLLITLTLALVSCGPDARHIVLDGKLLNLNQGEFLVYSPDGATDGVDTITLQGGRFKLETQCQHSGTVVVLLPGGQEVAVFVKPGKSYSLSGDAQNLREVSVSGGTDNKLMNEFRKSAAATPAASAAATRAAVRAFVEEHPASAPAMYLVGRHLLGDDGDYALALRLIATIRKARPDDPAAEVLQSRVQELANAAPGHTVPPFAATDLDGKAVTAATLASGTWVVATYASWDYESTAQVRRILSIRQETGATYRVLAVSLDASRYEAIDALRSLPMAEAVTNVCDGLMTETPIAARLAMRQTGMTLITRNGRITDRGLSGEPLYSRLRNHL